MKRPDLDDVLVADKTRPEPTPAPVNPDLSAEIALNIAREKGDRVKVRRVFGDNYRCNWLSSDDRRARGATLALETLRVRDSKFLRVRRNAAGELEIEDVTAKVAGSN